MDYIFYLDVVMIEQLLKSGLDLNPITHNGVANLTFRIGNAENDRVSLLLQLAKDYQTDAQIQQWINKPDEIIRSTLPPSCCCAIGCLFFSRPDSKPSQVGQTALMLTIAKGYKGIDGLGLECNPSNFELAKQLLNMGASKAINYREPTKGNTALHLACARREYEAIELLLQYGASNTIKNHQGQMPRDMLMLNFQAVNKLLTFHTSPDGHPRTYVLNKAAFIDRANVTVIQQLLNQDPANITQSMGC